MKKKPSDRPWYFVAKTASGLLLAAGLLLGALPLAAQDELAAFHSAFADFQNFEAVC